MHAEKVIDRGRKCGSAPRPGGPDLRADQLDQPDGRITGANALCHAQHEAPGIDQNNDLWLASANVVCGGIGQTYDVAVCLDAFHEAENR